MDKPDTPKAPKTFTAPASLEGDTEGAPEIPTLADLTVPSDLFEGFYSVSARTIRRWVESKDKRIPPPLDIPGAPRWDKEQAFAFLRGILAGRKGA